jgi:hypothetical protein
MLDETVVLEEIHPEVQAAMDAVNIPEVQEMIRKLSRYGLAVAAPHLHGSDGTFLPLPADRVIFERRLQMTFPSATDPCLEEGIPVMWRWDGQLQAVAKCAQCDKYGGHK